ncbi:MAG: putative thioesterase [Mycobacterium sp.]|jgi:acyl-CoA thioester hydrolase|nr:putative thioesterase [Mycobacterium sp.]
MGDFDVTRTLSTRWADTDVYGHVNNAVYTQLFDTAINGWIIEETGFNPAAAPVIGVVVQFSCTYYREITFPQTLTVGIRITKIGRTSVSYDLALLAGPDDTSGRAAQAQWTHVYIDRETRRPVEIPAPIRSLLAAHHSPVPAGDER